MGAQNLDQSAIDMLFATSDSGQAFLPVNFQTRKSLTPYQMQLLAVENQIFCRSISARLSSWLSADAKVSLLAAERMLFSDYLELNDINSMYLGEARLLSTQPALMSFAFSFVGAVINLVLGGPSKNVMDEGPRDLTAVDTAVMDILLKTMWSELNQSWSTLSFNPTNMSSLHPANVGKAFAHSEYLLIFTYEMKVENVEGILQLALSTTVADTLLRELDHQEPSHEQSPEVKAILQHRIGATSHKVHLRSPVFQLRVADILALTTGTVLPCGLAPSSLARLGVEGGKIMVAIPSQRGGRVVAQLLDPAL